MINATIHKDIKGQQLKELLTIIGQHSTVISVARYFDSDYSYEKAIDNNEKVTQRLRIEYDENINGYKDYLDKECSTLLEVNAYFDNIYKINLEAIYKQKPLLIKEKIGLLSDLADFMKVEYSNNTPVTNGPKFEILYFEIDDIFNQLKLKLPSLFKFPYAINGNNYEDIAFYNEDRIVMAVCSHEKFVTFNLTEEEYDLIKETEIFK